MSPEITILCSLISGISMLAVGKIWGTGDKVDHKSCEERRLAADKLQHSLYTSIFKRLDKIECLLNQNTKLSG